MTIPVSFELAKLLKEKGFITPCFHYYENEKLIEPYLENGSSTDVEFRVDLSDLKEHFNKWSKIVSAPTIAEVVMWLYEKHDVWIEVKSPDYSKELWPFAIHRPYKFGSYGDGTGYKSPTEAYEAAIEYCLMNLM